MAEAIKARFVIEGLLDGQVKVDGITDEEFAEWVTSNFTDMFNEEFDDPYTPSLSNFNVSVIVERYEREDD